MASLVIRFFFSLIPSNQRTNVCNFVTKVNKITKTVEFSANVVYKALIYYDVTVKFSPVLKETFGHIIAKQLSIKLRLASSGAVAPPGKNIGGGAK